MPPSSPWPSNDALELPLTPPVTRTLPNSAGARDPDGAQDVPDQVADPERHQALAPAAPGGHHAPGEGALHALSWPPPPPQQISPPAARFAGLRCPREISRPLPLPPSPANHGNPGGQRGARLAAQGGVRLGRVGRQGGGQVAAQALLVRPLLQRHPDVLFRPQPRRPRPGAHTPPLLTSSPPHFPPSSPSTCCYPPVALRRVLIPPSPPRPNQALGFIPVESCTESSHSAKQHTLLVKCAFAFASWLLASPLLLLRAVPRAYTPLHSSAGAPSIRGCSRPTTRRTCSSGPRRCTPRMVKSGVVGGAIPGHHGLIRPRSKARGCSWHS